MLLQFAPDHAIREDQHTRDEPSQECILCRQDAEDEGNGREYAGPDDLCDVDRRGFPEAQTAGKGGAGRMRSGCLMTHSNTKVPNFWYSWKLGRRVRPVPRGCLLRCRSPCDRSSPAYTACRVWVEHCGSGALYSDDILCASPSPPRAAFWSRRRSRRSPCESCGSPRSAMAANP